MCIRDSCERRFLPPLFLAQKIDAHVTRQAKQPRGKARFKLVLPQRAPCLDERLLRQIQRVIGVCRHAKAEVIDLLLVRKQQLLEGGIVALLRPADQLFF